MAGAKTKTFSSATIIKRRHQGNPNPPDANLVNIDYEDESQKENNLLGAQNQQQYQDILDVQVIAKMQEECMLRYLDFCT